MFQDIQDDFNNQIILIKSVYWLKQNLSITISWYIIIVNYYYILNTINCFNNYKFYKCLKTTILIFIEKGSVKDSMPSRKEEKKKQEKLKSYQKRLKILEDLKPNSLTNQDLKKKYKWKKLLNNIKKKIQKAEYKM